MQEFHRYGVLQIFRGETPSGVRGRGFPRTPNQSPEIALKFRTDVSGGK